MTNVPREIIESRAQSNAGKRTGRESKEDEVRTASTAIGAGSRRTGILNLVAGIGERLVAQREGEANRLPQGRAKRNPAKLNILLHILNCPQRRATKIIVDYRTKPRVIDPGPIGGIESVTGA